MKDDITSTKLDKKSFREKKKNKAMEDMRLTLFVCHGEAEKGDEGHNSQQGEDDSDKEKELESLQPGAPVVLQVHDVGDKSPECKYTWGGRSDDRDRHKV